VSAASEHTVAVPRPTRSKNGCNACRFVSRITIHIEYRLLNLRKRKVRCNERRPRCAHCERLNLDCTWNRSLIARNNTAQASSSWLNTSLQTPSHHQVFNPNLLPLDGFGMGSNAFYDFTTPLGISTWDEAMLLDPNSSDPSTTETASRMEVAARPIYRLPLSRQSFGSHVEATPMHGLRGSVQSIQGNGPHQSEPASTSSPFAVENAPLGIDEEFLLHTFLQMLMPPILTPVEVGPSTRAFFEKMAIESPIVKSAIMAFAAMQMQRSGLGGDAMMTDWRPLYDIAARHLSSALAKKGKNEANTGIKVALKYTLASLFLLIYTDVSQQFMLL
jgi:hypothetical protein